MRNTKKAFTLVELIVVITILAILGTIAFISLQGYSSDARNSKRSADLGSIISKMTIQITKGVSLLSFVGTDTANGNTLSNASIAGTGTTATDYAAGEVNYLALDMKATEFSDPVDKSYVIGVTTKVGAKYQVAATKETGGGAPVAIVKGNWINRDTSTLVINTPATTDTTITFTTSTDSNKMKVGDFVNIGASTRKITKVSDNGMIMTLDSAVGVTTATVALAAVDSASLIGSEPLATTTTPITDGGTLVPYKIN